MRRFALAFIALAVSACSSENNDSAKPAVTPPEYMSIDPQSIVLKGNRFSVAIIPQEGGRIGSLVFDGSERLFTSTHTDANHWGSVLWTSPQSDWGWPPPEALDSGPYQVSILGDGVQMTSEPAPSLGVVVQKHYSLDRSRESLIIRYRIENVADKDITLAPWEVTRLPAGGVIYFPKGETDYFTGDFSGLPFVERDGISWYDYDPADIGHGHHKVMTDGEEGWLAYAERDFLLVKVFENVPSDLMAPEEGEIELYADPTGEFIELEQQGYLTTLQPAEALTWQVVWAFDSLPEGAIGQNRKLLVQRARQLAGRARGKY